MEFKLNFRLPKPLREAITERATMTKSSEGEVIRGALVKELRPELRNQKAKSNAQ